MDETGIRRGIEEGQNEDGLELSSAVVGLAGELMQDAASAEAVQASSGLGGGGPDEGLSSAGGGGGGGGPSSTSASPRKRIVVVSTLSLLLAFCLAVGRLIFDLLASLSTNREFLSLVQALIEQGVAQRREMGHIPCPNASAADLLGEQQQQQQERLLAGSPPLSQDPSSAQELRDGCT